ncbi:Vacuolar calcium ion transporter 2 [Colletotrichum chrysophilum]|uniref:Vacuolar calcium ion transporter n=1 Tax=Colletotrichum chrysophilum TaxID=1836956 RepID=A0AAD9A2W0_9PEZI|nr:Vacuolar calcium ion transporter 2 [Colletotrichum chrysophilum]
MPTERSPLLSHSASHRPTSSAFGGFYKAWHEAKAIMSSNHLQWLLAIVPFAITAPNRSWSPVKVFATNFFAIMPLSAVLSLAIERISMNLGAEPKEMLRATSGNAVEFVVGILALKHDLFTLARSIVLGSILFSLLPNMGLCFFLGGIANMRDRVTVLGSEQCFPQGTAQTICTVIAVPMTSVAMSAILSSEFGDEHPAKRDQSILAFSRGAAIIFLLLYVTYHWFKSRTHSDLFCDETPPDETEDSVISIVAATAVLAITVALAVVCADNLVGSINPFAEVTHVGPDFIGFFLVPIAINAAKASAAVGKATRNRMDLAMDIILNSITETGLLVAPCLVILAWALFHKSMTLQFELVPTVTYVFATLAAAVVVRDGRSNYLEGALLLGFYVIIGLAVFFGPVDG